MTNLLRLNYLSRSMLALCFYIGTSVSGQANIVDRTISLVNQDVILASELNAAVENLALEYSAQNQPLPENFKEKVLQELQLRSIQLQMVEKFNIKTAPENIQNTLTGIAKQNNFKSVEAFKQALNRSQPGKFNALEKQINEDLAINELTNQVLQSRIKINEDDIEAYLKNNQFSDLSDTNYRLSSFFVPNVDVSNTQSATLITKLSNEFVTVTDTNGWLKQKNEQGIELKGGDLGYKAESKLPVELLQNIQTLKIGELTPPIFADDGAYIFKLTDKKTNADNIIDQFKTAHILIKRTEQPDQDKFKIEQLYKELQQGANFNELASTYSQDLGSGRRGGDLGWVSPGMMVKEFEQVMFATDVGDFSKPFTSQFGWHILIVTDKRKYDATNDIKRNMAEKSLYQQRYNQALVSWQDELLSKAFIKNIE